jgi:hypothetical protein
MGLHGLLQGALLPFTSFEVHTTVIFWDVAPYNLPTFRRKVSIFRAEEQAKEAIRSR